MSWFSSACGNKVDPVYEALRMATSLAQKAKRQGGSDSPLRTSVRFWSTDETVFFRCGVIEIGWGRRWHLHGAWFVIIVSKCLGNSISVAR